MNEVITYRQGNDFYFLFYRKLNAFIAYFRSAVLIQIVISSVDIIFNWFIIASVK